MLQSNGEREGKVILNRLPAQPIGPVGSKQSPGWKSQLLLRADPRHPERIQPRSRRCHPRSPRCLPGPPEQGQGISLACASQQPSRKGAVPQGPCASPWENGGYWGGAGLGPGIRRRKAKAGKPTGWVLPRDLYEPEHHHSCWLYHPSATPASPGLAPGCKTPPSERGEPPAASPSSPTAQGRWDGGRRAGGSADIPQRAGSLSHPCPFSQCRLQAAGLLGHFQGISMEIHSSRFFFFLSTAPPQGASHCSRSLGLTHLQVGVKSPPPWCTSTGLARLRRQFFSSNVLEIKCTEKVEAPLPA